MPSRVATTLLVVGLLLIPGPVYAAAVDSMTPDRVPQGYSAEPVDLDDPETREQLAETFDDDVTLSLYHLTDSPASSDRTAAVLREAYRGGELRVTDEAVRAEIQALARNYTFLRSDADHDPRLLVLDPSADALVVTTRHVSFSEVFREVRGDAVVEYESLSPAERATIDRILNTSGSDAYYRPYENDPHPDFPVVVEKGGAHYLVQSTIVVDDFSPDGFYLGVLGTGGGVVALLAGGLLTVLDRHDVV